MGLSQRLTFAVRVARNETDLAAVREVRAAAYGRHAPELARGVAVPDVLDDRPDSTVVLARGKPDGMPLGTVRISVDTDRPLQIEQALPLARFLGSAPAAEVTRLAVLPGHRDPTLTLALMKAVYLVCLVRQVRWMVIGARNPALVRQYTMLGFSDIADGGLSVPLDHAGGIEHRVLVFDVTSAERHWRAAAHPLYEFMVLTRHPDIDLLAADDAPARW